MKHWFKDQHFRSLLKNSSYLGGSKIVAALGGVATLAFAGRGLGVMLFGALFSSCGWSAMRTPGVFPDQKRSARVRER